MASVSLRLQAVVEASGGYGQGLREAQNLGPGPSASLSGKETLMNRTILWSLGLTVVVNLVTETGAAPHRSSVRSIPSKTCSATAAALYTACKAQTISDAFVAKAKCFNVTDAPDRT